MCNYNSCIRNSIKKYIFVNYNKTINASLFSALHFLFSGWCFTEEKEWVPPYSAVQLRHRPCVKCVCDPNDGIVCENIICPPTKCSEDEEQLTEPGACCSRCRSMLNSII